MSYSDGEKSETALSPWYNWIFDGALGLASTTASATFDKSGNGEVQFWPLAWWLSANNHQVLDTDYKNYAVVHGCDNWPLSWLPVWHTKNSWLLSRKPTVSEEIVTKAKATMNAKVMNY